MGKLYTLLLLSISACLPFHIVGQAVYDTLARKQSVQFDVGSGLIFVRQSLFNQNNSSYSTLYGFHSGASFLTSFGYNLKLDRMQFEWKIGYSFFSYSIDVEQHSYGRGPTTFPRYSGSTTQHAGYIQLLGVTFGKERSWGSLQIGPYLRYNFWVAQQNYGKKIRSGSYLDGNRLVPVYHESPFEAPFFFAKYTLGFQLGANFKLKNDNELHTRIELNSNGNLLDDYSAIHASICIGYVLPFKRDKVLMRRR